MEDTIAPNPLQGRRW